MNVIAVNNSRAGNPSSIQLAPPLAPDLNGVDGVGTAGGVFNRHGEVEKDSHRQYGIYSTHVHHLLSSPPPHDNNDNDDVLDPLLSPPSDDVLVPVPPILMIAMPIRAPMIKLCPSTNQTQPLYPFHLFLQLRLGMGSLLLGTLTI